MTIIAMTGHREEKISDEEDVRRRINYQLRTRNPIAVIVGMANGVDLWAGCEALDLGLAVIAARPWAGHKPRQTDREAYERIIGEATWVVNVNPSDKYPGPWVYQVRNVWMVDNADKVFAIWDGSSGGTKNCFDYAMKVRRPILQYNPVTMNWFVYVK